jgi:hypothetical protein
LPELRAEELVDRVEQVVDVLLRWANVLDVAVVTVVGRTDQSASEPRQREDRAPVADRHDGAADER